MMSAMIDLSDLVQPFWKPEAWSSFDVIRQLRRVTGVRKIGHAGTLDPFATGVLVLLFGRATKRSAELMAHQKSYLAEVLLGQQTDTLDPTGKVEQTLPVPAMDEAAIRAVLGEFVGHIQQVPPMFSALRWGGQRLYEIARNGDSIELEARAVHIDDISLCGWQPPDRFTISVTCGKGTYVRSLARDIAQALGTVGHLAALTRTRVGPYSKADAVRVDELDKWIPIEA